MSGEEGKIGYIDNIIDFIKKDIHVLKDGIITKDNGDGSFDVDFKIKGVNALSYPASRDKTLKTKIHVGDIVEVEFADLPEWLFLTNKQNKIEAPYKLHALGNGIIRRIIKPYNAQQDDILIDVDGKLFNIRNNQYNLKTLFKELKTILSDFTTLMNGQLTTFINSMTPTSATPTAQANFLQALQQLTTTINTLQTNMDKLLKD